MDKYLVLLEQLNKSEDTLITRKNKKIQKLEELKHENQMINNSRIKTSKKLVELYNVKKAVLTLRNVATQWSYQDAPKAKKGILTYGIVSIVSILLAIAAYLAIPQLAAIISILTSAITVVNSVAVIFTVVKPALKFLTCFRKNKKIIKGHDIDSLEQKINRNEKQIYKLDKEYERNNEKIETLEKKIEILRDAIQHIQNLINSVQNERAFAMHYELEQDNVYNKAEIKNILNNSYENSDIIKLVRVKEREIMYDN